MTTYRVEVAVDVLIEVNDERAIRRCVENEDGWREQFYPITTRDEVLEHWAYNAVANGQSSVQRLDGWADLPPEAVRMRLDGFDPLIVQEVSA